MVRRVREVLRLEAHAVALPIREAARAEQASIEKIARVELDPGLGRLDVEDAAAARVDESGRRVERAGWRSRRHVEDPVVVVAASQQQLRVAATDPSADRRRPTE